MSGRKKTPRREKRHEGGESRKSAARGWVVSGGDRYEMTVRTLVLTDTHLVFEDGKGASRVELPLEDIGMVGEEGIFSKKLMVKEKGDYKGKYLFKVEDVAGWTEAIRAAMHGRSA